MPARDSPGCRMMTIFCATVPAREESLLASDVTIQRMPATRKTQEDIRLMRNRRTLPLTESAYPNAQRLPCRMTCMSAAQRLHSMTAVPVNRLMAELMMFSACSFVRADSCGICSASCCVSVTSRRLSSVRRLSRSAPRCAGDREPIRRLSSRAAMPSVVTPRQSEVGQMTPTRPGPSSRSAEARVPNASAAAAGKGISAASESIGSRQSASESP